MLSQHGKSMTPAQQALSKSVHFTLGNSIVPTKVPESQSVIVKPNPQPEVNQVTAIDCVMHARPLKGFCIDPEFKKRRKLCVTYLILLSLGASGNSNAL
jgi:hypothetical protein